MLGKPYCKADCRATEIKCMSKCTRIRSPMLKNCLLCSDDFMMKIIRKNHFPLSAWLAWNYVTQCGIAWPSVAEQPKIASLRRNMQQHHPKLRDTASGEIAWPIPWHILPLPPRLYCCGSVPPVSLRSSLPCLWVRTKPDIEKERYLLIWQ